MKFSHPNSRYRYSTAQNKKAWIIDTFTRNCGFRFYKILPHSNKLLFLVFCVKKKPETYTVCPKLTEIPRLGSIYITKKKVQRTIRVQNRGGGYVIAVTLNSHQKRHHHHSPFKKRCHFEVRDIFVVFE